MSESRRVRRGHARLCFLLLRLLLLAFPFHRASRAGYLDLRPRFGLCVDFGRSWRVTSKMPYWAIGWTSSSVSAHTSGFTAPTAAGLARLKGQRSRTCAKDSNSNLRSAVCRTYSSEFARSNGGFLGRAPQPDAGGAETGGVAAVAWRAAGRVGAAQGAAGPLPMT
jgi:hypothetical protein